MDARNELLSLIGDALNELGVEAGESLDAVADYAAERAEHLSTIVGQAGFMQAVEAEARNVHIKAAISAASLADGADERFVRIVQGGLRVVAGVLA